MLGLLFLLRSPKSLGSHGWLLVPTPFLRVAALSQLQSSCAAPP